MTWLDRRSDRHGHKVTEAGWFLLTDEAGFLWDAPKPLKRPPGIQRHAKAVTYCPAVVDYESRFFEVPCPFDVKLQMKMKEGRPQLILTGGDRASVVAKTFAGLVVDSLPNQWRSPDKPIVQIKTPYCFVADFPTWLKQHPPFHHYFATAPPGTVIGGRFPIHIWPRPLSWAFEWYDLDQELTLKRGEPWFLVELEPERADQRVRLIEAELTPELQRYISGTRKVVEYTNNTFSLFKTALSRRPKRLLQSVRRG